MDAKPLVEEEHKAYDAALCNARDLMDVVDAKSEDGGAQQDDGYFFNQSLNAHGTRRPQHRYQSPVTTDVPLQRIALSEFRQPRKARPLFVHTFSISPISDY